MQTHPRSWNVFVALVAMITTWGCSSTPVQDGSADGSADSASGFVEAGVDLALDTSAPAPDVAGDRGEKPDLAAVDSAGAVDAQFSPDSQPAPDLQPAPDTAQPAPDATQPGADAGAPKLTCAPAACPACATGKQCAAKGPYLAGTCCAAGDSLRHLGQGKGDEVVDLETDGTYAVVCGGFGATISDVTTPASPVYIGSATLRCQRAAFGAQLANGARVFYLAHHGDSWVTTPFFATYYITAQKKLQQVGLIQDASKLFEGLLFHNGVLYVAAHDGGVLVYKVDSKGAPTYHAAITTGISNAWKLAAFKDRLYVADQAAGLHVMSLAAPLAPKLLHTVKTTGSPRDVTTADGKRVFVALGGAGFDVFDSSGAGAPKLVKNVSGEGSTQAVDAAGGLLAVANWSHVALHDAASLALVATERLPLHFPQVLGVALHKDLVLAGEWFSMQTWSPPSGASTRTRACWSMGSTPARTPRTWPRSSNRPASPSRSRLTSPTPWASSPSRPASACPTHGT